MNLFALTATIQGGLFKHIAKQGVSVIEFCFFRNVFIGGLASFQSCYKKQNPFKGFPKHLVKDLIIRSLAGQITFALLNYSFTLLPISTGVIIIQTNPFWISILACFLLKERIRLIEIVGIMICFGGVIMIGLSKAQKSDDSQEDKLDVVGGKVVEDEEEDQSEFDLYFGIAVAFSGAWTFAVCSVFNRKLKEIGYEALMVYHGLIGGSAASLFILIEGAFRGGFRFYTSEQYIILLVACAFDCAACNSMTIAYQRDSSGFVSLLGYAIILYGFLADLIFFNEEI